MTLLLLLTGAPGVTVIAPPGPGGITPARAQRFRAVKPQPVTLADTQITIDPQAQGITSAKAQRIKRG